MAFSNLKKYDLDASDVAVWKKAGCTALLIGEIQSAMDVSMRKLLKDGEKGHSANAEAYKAFARVLSMIEDA